MIVYYTVNLRTFRMKPIYSIISCTKGSSELLLIMFQKLQRRLHGLQLISWSEDKKDIVKQVLKKEYISSDESDISDDEAGPVLRGYKTKVLPWERSRLTKIKKDLDFSYLQSLPSRTRGTILQRTRHPEASSRPLPMDPVSWATRMPVVTSTPQSANNTSNINSVSVSPIV